MLVSVYLVGYLFFILFIYLFSLSFFVLCFVLVVCYLFIVLRVQISSLVIKGYLTLLYLSFRPNFFDILPTVL